MAELYYGAYSHCPYQSLIWRPRMESWGDSITQPESLWSQIDLRCGTHLPNGYSFDIEPVDPGPEDSHSYGPNREKCF